MTANELLQYALLYASRGWPVIPLHTPTNGGCSCGEADCTHIGKHPLIRKWQERATTNEALIRDWWREWPDANVGIATGQRSGLLVVDHDDGFLNLDEQEQVLYPVVSTGKGYHIYYQHPGTELSNRVRFADGRDLRSDGGLVVAPPSLHANGKRYTWISSYTLPLSLPPQDLLDQLVSDDPPQHAPSSDPSQGGGNTGYVAAALAREVAKVRAALEGTRNEQLNKSAFALGTLIGGGELDQALVADTLLEAARACGLGEGEARKTIASGLEAGKKKPRTVAPPVAPAQRPPASAEPASIHAWTPAAYIADRPGMLDSKFLLSCLSEEEYGDAKLLARLYDGKLCYDHAEKAWYVWGGHAWYRDQTLLIRHLIAGQVARQYLLLAADSDGMTPKSQIELLTKRAIKLRTLNRCNNIASFAQSFLGITGEEWDRNPWLLGVANGVLDLRSGKLRPGQPGDYIRTVIPTIWRGIDEPAPRFEQFIGEIFDNNQQIGAFVQRLLGYGITGLTVEHIFPVLYGEKGRNGKDTLLETLKAVLGDCADTVSTDVLLAQSGRGNAQPHLVDLMGKRLVWASETSVNARLNEAQVKLITGGGTVKTRPLYGNMIEFDPTHLVLLITNHKPRANADDDALWNRIVLLPFTLRFVANPAAADERQRDPHLRQKLTRERSGILAWLIRGCLAWQQQGLAIPDEVRASTDEYRNEEDLINQFIEENCLVGPQAECAAKDLYQSYRDWAEDMGMNPMGNNSFGRRIGKRFERKRTNRAFSYIGIGLLSSQNSDRSDRSDPLIRKVPMENEIHEKSFVLKDHFDHFDTQNNGFTASESETSLEQIDHASEKSITSAHPPPGQGAAGRAIPLQGAGKPNVNDERRDLITQARALLKDVGTASELATVDVSGRSVQELRTLIGRLEERRNQYE